MHEIIYQLELNKSAFVGYILFVSAANLLKSEKYKIRKSLLVSNDVLVIKKIG